jgi:hypothetical protein
MLRAQSTIKPLHSYFPHTCWVRQVLTLAINNVAQKEEVDLKSCEDVAGARRTQPLVDCLRCFVIFVSKIKRKSLIIFLFLTWYWTVIHLYVTICMEIDPGIHIVMHLVFFEKIGVTSGAGYCSVAATIANSWLGFSPLPTFVYIEVTNGPFNLCGSLRL